MNRIKVKNHIIFSIDTNKAFKKIQHFFMIKVLKKVGIEGTLLNIIKVTYDKPIANLILNEENLKLFPLIRNETVVFTIPTHIQYSTGIPSQSNKTEKEIKVIQIGEEEVKLLLFADDVILFLKGPKNSIPKFLNCIHMFSKVERYKKYTKISSISTYSEQLEKEIRKIIPFAMALKKLKYLEISLMKEVKDIFNENFKSLKKSIKTLEDGRPSYAHRSTELIL
jgi:hypothetical protein